MGICVGVLKIVKGSTVNCVVVLLKYYMSVLFIVYKMLCLKV